MVAITFLFVFFLPWNVCAVIRPGDRCLLHAQEMKKVGIIFSYNQSSIWDQTLLFIKKMGGCMISCMHRDESEIDDFQKELQRIGGLVGVPFSMIPFRQDECVLCLEIFENFPSEIFLFRCGHYFHNQCAHEFIFKKNQCPSCRFPINHSQDYIKVLLCDD